MALIRPSLTLVLDLDERVAGKETILEINRSYAHIGTPIIRTHKPAGADAALANTARMIINMGTYRYVRADDEGADERWRDIVDPWIGNMLHKVGNNMKVFNVRQRKIGLPEVVFSRLDIELEGGAFTVRLHPDPESALTLELHRVVDQARTLLNDGTLAGAVSVAAPSDASWEAQNAAAWEQWISGHPQTASEDAGTEAEATAEAEADRAAETEKLAFATIEDALRAGMTREEWLRYDVEAKSYENTAVAPTDSDAVAPMRQEEDAEEDPFTFTVDYTLWSVAFADGTVRTFDASAQTFVD